AVAGGPRPGAAPLDGGSGHRSRSEGPNPSRARGRRHRLGGRRHRADRRGHDPDVNARVRAVPAVRPRGDAYPVPMVTTLPYGSWPSPITAELLATGGAQLGAPRLVGEAVWWTEGIST